MLSLALCLLAAGALTSVLAVPLSPHQAASFPNPEPCNGNCSSIHDPSLVQAPDGTWFRFSTNGNIAIATAPDITGPWTYQGAMLPQGSSIHVTDGQQIWAPDVSILDGTFTAYYAVSVLGSQASDIGVATSSSGQPGTWTDHGSIGIPKSSAYNLIDPNFFREAPNTPIWFTFGSAWNDVYQTQLDGDYLTMQSGTGQTQQLFNSTVPIGQPFPSITEGSFQFWWLNGQNKWYYLFFSSGACCNSAGSLAAPGDEYKIMVCRSTTANGPWTDQNGVNCLTQNGGTLLLGSHGNIYAPGGQGVIYDKDAGRPVVYYHYVDTNIGYAGEEFQFGFNYLDFSSDWPVVVT